MQGCEWQVEKPEDRQSQKFRRVKIEKHVTTEVQFNTKQNQAKTPNACTRNIILGDLALNTKAGLLIN